MKNQETCASVTLDAAATLQAPGRILLNASAVIVGGLPYAQQAEAFIFRAPIDRIVHFIPVQRITTGKKVRRGVKDPRRVGKRWT